MTLRSDVGDDPTEVAIVDEASSLLKPTTDVSPPKWEPPRGFLWIEIGMLLDLKIQKLGNY
jgi:hypothetical protein